MDQDLGFHAEIRGWGGGYSGQFRVHHRGSRRKENTASGLGSQFERLIR